MEVTGPVTLGAVCEVVGGGSPTSRPSSWTSSPDGFAQNMTEGILRGALSRLGRRSRRCITPGQVYKMTVELWSTSNVFKKGHALRLEVSSSNFPRFDRNLEHG